VLYMGDEFDYYQGEIKDLILEVLVPSLLPEVLVTAAEIHA
jgi:hypothetical protein